MSKWNGLHHIQTRSWQSMTLHELASQLRDLGADAVYVFGSVAKGTAKPGSDLDVFAAGSIEAQQEIDRRYAWERPVVVTDGVARRAHIITAIIAGTDISAALFERMQPEARRIS